MFFITPTGTVSTWPSTSAFAADMPLASAILYQSEESPQSCAAIEAKVSPPRTLYVPAVLPCS